MTPAEVEALVDRLLPRLRRDEGWSSTVYLDTTDHLTIGYGHNLAKVVAPAGIKAEAVTFVPINGISLDVGEAILREDIRHAINFLVAMVLGFSELDPVRQEVLADMAFNMGGPAMVRKWPNFLESVREGRYEDAADTMETSLWKSQVGTRAPRLIAMMRTGRDSQSHG